MRFLAKGLTGIQSNAPRVSKLPAPRDLLAPLILETTLHVPPPNARCWSTRTLAATLGVSRSMVDRVWRTNGIKPQYISAAATPAPAQATAEGNVPLQAG